MRPRDRSKLDAYSEKHFFYPLGELPGWFSAARLRADDVAEMTFLQTIQDDHWRLEGERVHVDSDWSAVLLLHLTRAAPEILRAIPPSLATPEKLGGHDVLGFPSPAGGPQTERWYWAAPTEHTLAIGGRAAVEQVLAIAAGRGEALSSRRVLRPLLADIERSRIIILDVVPPAREAAMGSFRRVGQLVQSIPGISMLFSARGQATALETLRDGSCIQKLDYLFSERGASMAVWSVFRLLSLGGPKTWSFSGKEEAIPDEATPRRSGGLVMIHMRYDARPCREADAAGERVQLFAP